MGNIVLRKNRVTANTLIGKDGDLTINTTDKTLYIHDGSTTGGFSLFRYNAASGIATGEVPFSNGTQGVLQTSSNLKWTSPNLLINTYKTFHAGNFVAGTAVSITESPTNTFTIANTGVTSAVAGTGISVSAATGAVTITNSDRGSSQNIFKTINVVDSSDVAVTNSPITASSNSSSLTLKQGTGITFSISGSVITITSSGGSGSSGVTSLNGLAGALTLTSTHLSINPSGTNIALSITSTPASTLTGTIPSGVLGNSTQYVGTTAVALNRSSANQALTGISSVTFPGSTSGTIIVQPTAIAGTTTITLPATTGTVITTGDTSTVTNTMLAGSITYNKLSLSNSIVNADIATGAAIVYSKLSLANSIVNADIATTAAITYSKLSLSNSIVNADIATGAAIAVSKLAASTISGITLGNNLATLTFGSYLTGTSYNGSTAATIAVDATNLNTASKIVARDISGNFSAGTISASLSGNATTATTLQTGRTFSLSGDATGTSASFDGSANASIPVTLATVNSNIGQFPSVGVTNQIPVITVNAKGLVTSLSTVNLTTSQNLALTGAVTAASTSLSGGSLSTVFGVGSVNAGTNISVTGGGTSSITISVTGTVASATTASLVTNGVYTTGSYADPSWITSLSASKIIGTISGYVDTSTTQTINGSKTFTSIISGNITGTAYNITQYTINQNLGTSNSPSFAGLTVDTNTLFVDSTNHIVGIGTTSPAYKFDVNAVVSRTGNTGVNSYLQLGANATDLNNYLIGCETGSFAFYQGKYGGTSTERMRIDSSGNVGIGVTPSYKLHVSGAIYATGDVYAGSDIRMKENITQLTNALDKIKNLQGYSYNKIGIDHRSIGLIAQDVEKIIPEVVSRNTEGMKGIDYGQMIAMLVEAIKELNTKLETINGTSI